MSSTDGMTPGDAYITGYTDTTGETDTPPCVERVARGIFDVFPGVTLSQAYAMGQESARQDVARDAALSAGGEA